jgi:hypothetical protein
MMNDDDTAADRETNLFAPCETLAEVLVVVHRLLGPDAVDQLLGDNRDISTREGLREAADTFKRVGLIKLASLVRKHARRAKPAPMTFKTRWAHKRTA